MWYRWMADLGITGPDKGAGGKYLLLPPGYKDPVPDGYHVVRSPHVPDLGGWRSFLVNGDPKPGVDAVKQHTEDLPAGAGRQPAAGADLRQHVRQAVQHGRARPTASFWPMLHQVVQEEPTDTIDATTLGIWASIGIEKGKPFAPDARMKKILAEAAAVGDATAPRAGLTAARQGGLLLRGPAVEAALRRRLQVRDAAGRAEPRCRGDVLLPRHRRHAGDGHEGGRRGLHLSVDGASTPTASRSMAARPTGCTCRRTSRSRTSGRSSSTTRRPARCCRPTSASPPSAARTRRCR